MKKVKPKTCLKKAKPAKVKRTSIEAARVRKILRSNGVRYCTAKRKSFYRIKCFQLLGLALQYAIERTGTVIEQHVWKDFLGEDHIFHVVKIY